MRPLVALLLVAALGAGAYAYFTQGAQTREFAFEAAAVDKGSIERSVSATGSVQALITVDVSSQLSGQMSEVKVDFNSKVAKGDLLAKIDPQTFASRVASAEANLAIAKSNVLVQEATIAKSRALVEQAERDVARQRSLADRGNTPQATFENAETTLATAKADLQVAEANLANAKAVITQREAEVFQAKLDLSRTDIKSPIDGVVIGRNIDPGGTVAASLQAPVLFQIAQDLSQIQIETQVDEADIGAVEDGNAVTFTVDAYPDQTFTGKVAQVRIAGASVNNVVTYTVVVLAENPRQRLLPGMTATVRIVTGARADVLRVPNDAIRFTPPEDAPKTDEARRPNRDDAIVAQLSESLKLSPEQTERFRDALAASRTEQREGAPGGNSAQGEGRGGERGEGERGQRAGPGARGAQRQSRIARILDGILTPEQKKLFEELRAERRERMRPALVWIETPQGLEPRRIRIGLADESYSEVIGGKLEVGEKVVTRVRSETRPRRRS
ncbi:MAG: efflux RND transporter periplasmic adaptor subunit [Hyphomicrobiales bacterium]|nr:efflux RND transporter periplasmic adaptor subunit [Hyphomicrobiales bacterium]